MSVDLDAVHGEGLAEVGRVDHVDLQEQHVGRAGYRVGAALFPFLRGVLGAVAGLAAVGDDVDGVVVGEGIGDELARGRVELDAIGAQFGGARDPGDQ
ncbi:hypothetical protein [Streptomyces sp. NBC_01803]|uniref:hypothetical protein n=1 Tax=Streptomyces sp. NBC_01803 TaxID=2975946 RepID=UPI002DDBF026|nr:hypothetical protein [Streptomyces sp. NBC_01803]WSA47413.1 hypothetical protein OIE51_26525 [Streptomyces sp. NBC_01803]